MDTIFNISCITQTLLSLPENKGAFEQSKAQLHQVLPPNAFVLIAAIVAALTVSKSYFDTVQAATQIAPKLVVIAYTNAAWGLSLALAWIAKLVGDGQALSVDGSAQPAYLVLPQILIMRWSFILG